MKIALQDRINHLPPELQREVEDFVDFLTQRGSGGGILSRAASTVSEAAFESVWDNPEDGAYDRL